jgi:polysaccharide export outer membrane protein
MHRLGVAFIILMAGFLVGCGHPGPQRPLVDPEPPHGPNTYRSGDKIMIDFTDNTGVPPVWQQVVRDDGTITLPLNQTLVAAGKTEGELEQAIQSLYVPKYLTRLTVNVRAEQRTYFVSGEVKAPGQREHTGNLTALKAIAACGDFTDYADKGSIDIIRANGEKIRMDGKAALRDSSKDVIVHPGDTVHVQRRFF